MCELRAAVYVRTSSDRPPIGDQLAYLRARVAEDAVRVPAERDFVDDGFRGATLVRPGLDRLRELIAAGGVERLYVQSPDRLARMYAQQVLLLNEFRAAGVDMVCVDRAHAAPQRLTLRHA
jgi:site-specific DNA recombinase